ncbi:hypothetical protein [Nesterenkonia sp.]|uniref:hypothetical protein n=1 Tax=Nesterenkonia sp. TaxID=704201 RepID=UPI00262E7536|nr:hypothetical protein [Nesterenkonia sp.]
MPENEQAIHGALCRWIAPALRQYAASGKLLLGDYASAQSLIEPLVQPPVTSSGQYSGHRLYRAGLKTLILASSGDHRGAEELLDWVRGFPLPAGWETTWPGVPAAVAASYIAIADGDPDQARAQLALTEPYELLVDLWPLILDQRARLSLYFEPSSGLHEFLDALRARQSIAPTSRYWQLHLHVRAVGFAVDAGSLPIAAHHLQRCRGLDYPGRPGLSVERAEALYLLGVGRVEQARALVQTCLLREDVTAREKFTLRYLLAISEHRLGRTEHARSELHAALRLGDDVSLAHFHSAATLAEMLTAYAPDREDLLAEVRQRLRMD